MIEPLAIGDGSQHSVIKLRIKKRNKMELVRTITPKCTRYYANGKRVTKDKYDDLQFWKVKSCLWTQIEGDVTRHIIHVSKGSK